jgi:hypothetical protein
MTGPSISIAGLVSNAGNGDIHMTLDGWYAVAKPNAEIVLSGAGPGGIAVGPWDPTEAYYTLRGWVYDTNRANLIALRRTLLAALPAQTDNSLVVLGNAEDFDLQAFVRLYDKPDIDFEGNALKFTLPLVALDPLRYSLNGLTGVMGVFTGSDWYSTFVLDTAPTPDDGYSTFVLDTAPTPDDAYSIFQQAQSTSPYPQSVSLTSAGDVVSRRVTIEVTGPLTAGDWHIMHEQTGDELWADVSLIDGQSVVFDCYEQTATLEGTSVDSLVFGSFLSLRPGVNTYRLVSGTQSNGYATITEALEAYR